MDRLEEELGPKGLQVIRLNIQDPAGREIGARLGWEFTPTFIMFDAAGREVWREAGVIDPAAVRKVVAGQ
ncbi:MAG: hypothetical protein HY023_04535 [Chloroflexi bacterium]|nr:hypothetical protein [Chloroflexota bacterium]MBI3763195.1 hypothetical protein [Chloroflexota bacterium]